MGSVFEACSNIDLPLDLQALEFLARVSVVVLVVSKDVHRYAKLVAASASYHVFLLASASFLLLCTAT